MSYTGEHEIKDGPTCFRCLNPVVACTCPEPAPTAEPPKPDATEMLVALHNPRECEDTDPTHLLAVKLWSEEDIEALLQEFAKLADEAAKGWDEAGNPDRTMDRLVANCFRGAAQSMREAAPALYASTK